MNQFDNFESQDEYFGRIMSSNNEGRINLLQDRIERIAKDVKSLKNAFETLEKELEKFEEILNKLEKSRIK